LLDACFTGTERYSMGRIMVLDLVISA